jgi:hypothetical protein
MLTARAPADNRMSAAILWSVRQKIARLFTYSPAFKHRPMKFSNWLTGDKGRKIAGLYCSRMRYKAVETEPFVPWVLIRVNAVKTRRKR